MTVDVARYSPAAADEARWLNAIARRNTAWAHYAAADDLLEAAIATGLREGLAPYIRNLNATQHDYEGAKRDLIRERVWRRREQGYRAVAPIAI